jgi:hypothetical protein
LLSHKWLAWQLLLHLVLCSVHLLLLLLLLLWLLLLLADCVLGHLLLLHQACEQLLLATLLLLLLFVRIVQCPLSSAVRQWVQRQLCSCCNCRLNRIQRLDLLQALSCCASLCHLMCRGKDHELLSLLDDVTARVEHQPLTLTLRSATHHDYIALHNNW